MLYKFTREELINSLNRRKDEIKITINSDTEWINKNPTAGSTINAIKTSWLGFLEQERFIDLQIKHLPQQDTFSLSKEEFKEFYLI